MSELRIRNSECGEVGVMGTVGGSQPAAGTDVVDIFFLTCVFDMLPFGHM